MLGGIIHMVKLEKGNVEDIIALTPIQEGLLYHYMKDPEAEYYFEQLCLELYGEIEYEHFINTWNLITEQNEMLRTVFRWENISNPVQIVLKKCNPVITVKDISEYNEKDRLFKDIKNSDRANKFDLRNVPFRITLCKMETSRYMMVITNHHIIYDGWSNGIILKEFLTIYNELSMGKNHSLSEKSKFKSFVKWMGKLNKEQQKAYWSGYLSGFTTRTELPLKNISVDSERSTKNVFVEYSKETLASYALDNQVTLASVIYTAWGILLQKYNNNYDVIFGTTVSGRSSNVPGIEEIVGVFINTVPLRVNVIEDENTKELIQRVNRDIYERSEHELTPLIEIAKYGEINFKEDLFNSIVVMEDYPLDNALQNRDSSLYINSYELEETTSYDITLSIKVYDKLHINFNYNDKMFDEEFINRMCTHFINILEDIVCFNYKSVKDICILTEGEKERLLHEFNNNSIIIPEDKTVPELFEQRSIEDPMKIAVVYGTDCITYADLNKRANQLARYLEANGVCENKIVAVLLERSIDMVTGILAIWKLGAGYIPLSAKDPINRVADILRDSGTSALLTHSDFTSSQLESQYSGQIIEIDTQREKIEALDDRNVNTKIDRSAIAYIIYTSGSTGKPKGAMVEHLGMLNHICCKIDALNISEKSNIAQNASHMFDISVWQLFTSLVVGGTTYIYDNSVLFDIQSFLSCIIKDRITILEVVPSYLNLILEYLETMELSLAHLQFLVVTGEELKPALVRRWFSKYKITMVNAYGPTEASDDITHHFINKPVETAVVPIGKPLPNMNIYILDKNMNLCSIGIKGEIYVSGIGVGKGYINDEEKTNKAFLRDPFIQEEYVRMYKTGDLGCWNEDGTIDFFGRIDNQIKLNGFRIELGEIENVLLTLEYVNEAIVTLYEQTNNTQMLCAYIVTKAEFNLNTVKNYLHEKLPEYMVPSFIVPLNEFPLNENGKIDRKALPNPESQTITFIPQIELDSIIQKANSSQYLAVDTDESDTIQDSEKILNTQSSCFIIGESTLTIKCAQILLERGYSILGIASDDKRVMQWAASKSITTTNSRIDEILPVLDNVAVDYIFSIYSVLILPESIINLPDKGVINFHDSLLPKYAGMYVPSWAIINEEEYYGCTWHIMEKGIDTGAILVQEKFIIEKQETAFSLHMKCYEAAVRTFKKLLRDIKEDNLLSVEQDSSERSYYGKYKRPENAAIVSFDCKASKLDAFIRGLDLNTNMLENPLGLPKLVIKGHIFIIKHLSVLDTCTERAPGTVIGINSDSIIVATLTNDIRIDSLCTINGDSVIILDLESGCDLEVGTVLNNIGSNKLESINKKNSEICRSESYWVKKLVNSNYIGILTDLVIVDDVGNDLLTVKKVALPEEISASPKINKNSMKIISLFLTYISAVTKLNSFTINYSDDELLYMVSGTEGIFSDFLPVDVDIYVEKGLESNYQYLMSEVDCSKQRNTYQKDIFLRYPELHDKLNLFTQHFALGIVHTNNIDELIKLDMVTERNMTIAFSQDKSEIALLINQKYADTESTDRLIEDFLYFAKSYIEDSLEEVADGLFGKGFKELNAFKKVQNKYIDTNAISKKLLSYPNIEQAVVLNKVINENDSHLAAYIVSNQSIYHKELIEYLSGILDAALIPSEIYQLESLPIHDGKFDERVLRLLETNKLNNEICEEPKTDTEVIVADIWKEILNLEYVNTNSNFFDIGGNSLFVIRLIGRLKKIINKDIPVTTMFKYPTVKTISQYIDTELDKSKKSIENQNSEDLKEVSEQKNCTNKKVSTDVAIIGMSGRFPQSEDINEFWSNLKNGIEGITFFTDDELIEEGLDPEFIRNPNYVKAKGIVKNAEYFDAEFFGYSPREAQLMDPQIRFLHECAWEALEDAGYACENKSTVGLFVSSSNNYYWMNNVANQCRGQVDDFSINILNDRDFLSTHISYKLNLTGPSVTIQTACSSSMIAVITAIDNINNGKCEMALAGGVSITYPNKMGYLYQEGMINSPDGHCRAFDTDAKGTLMGNGIGLVVLKNLEKAVQNRDNIYAVIKGSAVNNDGNEKIGYTAPSINGQAKVIQEAQKNAGIKSEDISYIETHGTGTVLGDPIEIEGLTQAFDTQEKQICAIGSVKTNVGHLDAAAGITGIIKTALAIKNRLIPPILHYKKPNPGIDFNDSPFFVNTELSEWNPDGRPIYAGVSSFGIGGTNAHMILGEAPVIQEQEALIPNNLVVISARTEKALEKATINLKEYLENNSNINMLDFSYTLQNGRKAFPCRRMFVCDTQEDAIEILSSGHQTTQSSRVVRKLHTNRVENENKNIVFMFSGLGSQYINMGLELYEKEESFRNHLNYCFDILKTLDNRGIDYMHILYPQGESAASEMQFNLNDIDIAQPIVFCFEYATAKMLGGWGINPTALVGYSFGEYAAACLAGVFSVEDALKIILYRGYLISQLPKGAMLSVPKSKEQIMPLLNSVNLAIDNGLSCIVSGKISDVKAFEKMLNQKSIMCMYIDTSHALHSKELASIALEFENMIKGIKLNVPKIRYVSNLTGSWITDEQATDANYWARHMMETVRFNDDVQTLISENNETIFIEIGSGNDLSQMLIRCMNDTSKRHKVINTIRPAQRKVSDIKYLLNRIGELWLSGVSVDWSKLSWNKVAKRISLTSYPFERNYYWLDRIADNTESELKSKWFFGKKKNMEEWFYSKSWERLALRSEREDAEDNTERWLIFSGNEPIEQLFINKMIEYGKEIIVIEKGAIYEKVNNNRFIFNPCQRIEYNLLFEELCKQDMAPDGILHMWTLTNNSFDEENIDTVKSSIDNGFYSLLYIAQAIGTYNIVKDITIKLISNNVFDIIGGDLKKPENSTAYAPIKIIPLEYDNIKCYGIDINVMQQGDLEESRQVKLITEDILFNKNEKIVAFRGCYRWVPTIKRISLNKPQNKGGYLVNDGVYVITGGLGGMGLTIAKDLAREVKAKIILIGRTQLPDPATWSEYKDREVYDEVIASKIEKLIEIKKYGSEIEVINADVSDFEVMETLSDELFKKYGRINGIYHTAGVAEYDGVIQNKQYEQVERILAPKVYGTLIINKLFKDLDFIFMCSSLATVIYHTKVGQVAYCAANEFIDAFGSYKVANSYENTYVVNWADWQDVGMSVQSAEHWGQKLNMQNAQKILEDGISPNEGIGVIDTVLANKFNHVMASPEDLITKIDLYNKTGTTTLAEILDENRGENEFYQRPNLSSEYIAPVTEVEHQLCKIWEKLFGITQIGIKDDFFELGGDSLKAITAISQIHKIVNIRLTLAEFLKRSTISDFIEFMNTTEAFNEYKAIEVVENKGYYGLSSTQNRMYVLQELDPSSINYNMFITWEIEGDFNKAQFKKAFDKVIERHESLRTSFVMQNGEPVQIINKNVTLDIEYFKYAEKSETEQIIFQFRRPFTFIKAPLFRVGLIETDEQTYILMIDIHHIISDGISNNIIIKDLMDYYSNSQLEPLKIQYKDYAKWEQENKETEEYKAYEAYWIGKLSNDLPVLELPYDYDRPNKVNTDGTSIKYYIDCDKLNKLEEMSRKYETTLYTTLLCIFNILLLKITNQENIVVGTPIAGRNHADTENVVGMFVNTVLLKSDIDSNSSFIQYLSYLNNEVLESFENGTYQFDDLVKVLNIERNVGRNPIFDVMFSMQNMTMPSISLQGLICNAYEITNRNSQFDLSLDVMKNNDRLECVFEYSKNLFKSSTIERFISYFLKIVDQVTDNPDKAILDINILSNEDEDRLVELNQTEKNYEINKTIIQLFEEQVEKTPYLVALKYSNETLTYDDLNRRANILANHLYGMGVRTENVVALMIEPCSEMIISMLAILKVGAAYLPIDVETPDERIAFMLNEADSTVLITQELLREKANCIKASSGIENIVFADNVEVSKKDETNLGINHSPDDLIYVMYTSGTTGRPKGIMIENRSIANYCLWQNEVYNIGEGFKYLLLIQYTFDPSAGVIFSTLISGAALYVIDKYTLLNKMKLRKYIDENEIIILNTVPSFFKELLRNEEKLKSVRYVVMGGEVLDNGFKDELINLGYEVFNHYGPTEATIDSVYTQCSINKKVTLGKPIGNTKAYIVDKYLKLLPPGAIGELCISGEGIARGYIKNAVQTSKHFVQNPFEKQGLIYRTGDLARVNNENDIEFLGRMDHQVKISGIRIELEEIEKIVEKHNSITQSIVVCKDDKVRGKYLCAYYLSEKTIDETELRHFVSKYLIQTLMPAYFVHLNRLPTTTTGKVDRKALPEPEHSVVDNYVAPENEIQVYLQSIWKTVLNREMVSIFDNFFNIGGNSLLVIKTKSLIEDRFPEIEIVDLFTYPTIHKLSNYIMEKSNLESQKITLISGVSMKLSEEYLLTEDETNDYEDEYYNIYLNTEIVNSIEQTAKSIPVDFMDILAALYAYSLYNASVDDTVSIHMLTNSTNQTVYASSIDLGNIETKEQLYKKVNLIKNQNKSSVYSLLELDYLSFQKAEGEIMALIKWDNISRGGNQFSDIYDIIIDIKGNVNEGLTLSFDYNKDRLKKAKIRHLFELFTGLINEI